MRSIFGDLSGNSNISGEKKSCEQKKQSKRKIDKVEAVKRKGNVKKTAKDKVTLKQTGLENWAIRATEEQKTPMSKKVDKENSGSMVGDQDQMPLQIPIPALENETLDFDQFFPLSQEMKWKLESEKQPTGNNRRDMTTTTLEEEIREKNEEIKELNGIIKKILGVIPKRYYL